MSYYKCKTITIDKKNNKIFTTVADSNVFPINYHNREYMERYTDKTLKDKIIELLRDISGGNIHLNDSIYKWNYAIERTNKELSIGWSSLYNINERQDTIYYIGKKPFVYNDTERTCIEITESDINDSLVLDYEYNGNKQYYNIKEREVDNKRMEDFNNLYYDTFMKYFNEKDSGKEYTLFSDNLGYIKPTKNGFKYSMYGGSTKILGTYKEMYCKLMNIYQYQKYGIEIRKEVEE